MRPSRWLWSVIGLKYGSTSFADRSRSGHCAGARVESDTRRARRAQCTSRMFTSGALRARLHASRHDHDGGDQRRPLHQHRPAVVASRRLHLALVPRRRRRSLGVRRLLVVAVAAAGRRRDHLRPEIISMSGLPELR